MKRDAENLSNQKQKRDHEFESDDDTPVSAAEIEEQEVGLVGLNVDEKG